nr:uncharacterized protein LOC117856899 [Setaria viridis]
MESSQALPSDTSICSRHFYLGRLLRIRPDTSTSSSSSAATVVKKLVKISLLTWSPLSLHQVQMYQFHVRISVKFLHSCEAFLLACLALSSKPHLCWTRFCEHS